MKKAPQPPEIASISDNKPAGSRRDGPAKLELSRAYVAVFRGQSDERQRDVVFTDLSEFSGFFSVRPPGLSPDERAYNEGQRSVFGRILANINLTGNERDALMRATRHETIVSQMEGEF